MLLRYDFRGKFVTLLTVGSILAILVIWLRVAQGTILWIYSISITVFLIFMYLATSGYKPQNDVGGNARLHDRNTVRRASSRAEHMELSQDYDSVYSLPNDLRFRLVPPDPYCNALRVGDDLEDGLGHKIRNGC
jgi:hypothetical protein